MKTKYLIFLLIFISLPDIYSQYSFIEESEIVGHWQTVGTFDSDFGFIDCIEKSRITFTETGNIILIIPLYLPAENVLKQITETGKWYLNNNEMYLEFEDYTEIYSINYLSETTMIVYVVRDDQSAPYYLIYERVAKNYTMD